MNVNLLTDSEECRILTESSADLNSDFATDDKLGFKPSTLHVNAIQLEKASVNSSRKTSTGINVEKVDGGLLIRGIFVGAVWRKALPAFGFCLFFVGLFLTIIAYRGKEAHENIAKYNRRVEFTNNVRILGPVCALIGVLMFIGAFALRHVNKKAEDKDRHVGFYCPNHGDFFVKSSQIDSIYFADKGKRKYSKYCYCCGFFGNDNSVSDSSLILPVCPYSVSNSSQNSTINLRSSMNNQVFCPHAIPFIISSDLLSDGVASSSGMDIVSDILASRRSLPDIACFPGSKADLPTSLKVTISNEKRLSCPSISTFEAKGYGSRKEILKQNLPPIKIDRPYEKRKISPTPASPVED